MTLAPPNVSAVQEVPEKIRIWREEQLTRLELKDKQEIEANDALRESAKKELESWYNHYNDSKDKTKTLNRNSDQEMSTADTNGASSDDTIWESISKLCDFGAQAKAPKNARDTTRMRSILLQMKSSPLAKST